jgi:hypothetical protein
MFKRLNAILNFIVFLTLLSTAIAATTPKDKDIDVPPQAMSKQKPFRAPSTQHLPALKKLTQTPPKDKVIISSLIINEEDLGSALNLNKTTNPFQLSLLHLYTNNSYIYNTNEQVNNINNRDRIKLERLNRINTFEKSLGKNKYIENDSLNPFPAHISISPFNKSQTIYVPISIPIS